MSTSERYLATLDELFDREPGAHGYDQAEIDAAERRLGRALPAVLVAHYLAHGRRSFQRAHDRLLPPSGLRVEDGRLLFYAENQSVFHWAIELDPASDDPPVVQSVDDGLTDWFDDHDRLSEFFFTMLYHHRVRARWCAHGRAERGALDALAPISLPGCRRELTTFRRLGAVVVEIDDLNEGSTVRVLAGSRSESELRAFQRAQPVAWT